jgi:hypothetical protein
MGTPTYKTSTILVSTGKRTRVFRSIEDMPEGLRKRVTENIVGPNSRTLVVADRRGREYLLKLLNRPAMSLVGNRETRKNVAALKNVSAPARYWIEIGLIALLGLISWALFHWK